MSFIWKCAYFFIIDVPITMRPRNISFSDAPNPHVLDRRRKSIKKVPEFKELKSKEEAQKQVCEFHKLIIKIIFRIEAELFVFDFLATKSIRCTSCKWRFFRNRGHRRKSKSDKRWSKVFHRSHGNHTKTTRSSHNYTARSKVQTGKVVDNSCTTCDRTSKALLRTDKSQKKIIDWFFFKQWPEIHEHLCPECWTLNISSNSVRLLPSVNRSS